MGVHLKDVLFNSWKIGLLTSGVGVYMCVGKEGLGVRRCWLYALERRARKMVLLSSGVGG